MILLAPSLSHIIVSSVGYTTISNVFGSFERPLIITDDCSLSRRFCRRWKNNGNKIYDYNLKIHTEMGSYECFLVSNLKIDLNALAPPGSIRTRKNCSAVLLLIQHTDAYLWWIESLCATNKCAACNVTFSLVALVENNTSIYAFDRFIVIAAGRLHWRTLVYD